MAAGTLMAPRGPGGPRRRGSPITFGRVLVAIGVGVAVMLVWALSSRITVTDRPNEIRTTTVVLPPPPPPPPPPEPEQVEQPPEPTVAPPLDQPVDTPPPDASSDPTPGDNALTAREGAGPSNYGLSQGDGSGTRIGTRPGGDNGFAAYGSMAARELQLAAQSDRELSRGRYSVRLAITVDAEGRVTQVRVLDGGDTRRNERLVNLFTGLRLSRRPPAGLPVMRVALNARSGA